MHGLCESNYQLQISLFRSKELPLRSVYYMAFIIADVHSRIDKTTAFKPCTIFCLFEDAQTSAIQVIPEDSDIIFVNAKACFCLPHAEISLCY